MSLKSKTVVVTGGAGGLGKAISKAFLEAGANVVVFDINEDLLNTASEELSPLGPLHTISVNITDENQITAAIEGAVAKFGDLDILVNNAGIMDKFDPIGDLDFSLWGRIFDINVKAPAMLSKLAINHFKKREKGPNGGIILNIGSAASLKGFTAGAAYTASKHSLVGLTKNTAAFYNGAGIRCNIILPGGMRTNIHSAFSAGLNKEGYELMMKGMATGTELCDVDKVGKTCVFLSSEESSVINGAVISADNGWLAI